MNAYIFTSHVTLYLCCVKSVFTAFLIIPIILELWLCIYLKKIVNTLYFLIKIMSIV